MEKYTRVIIPAAGQSKRFPNMKPKYLLCDVNGQMMIESAIQSVVRNIKDICSFEIVLLREHCLKFDANILVRSAVKKYGVDTFIRILDHPTDGPASTVRETIEYFTPGLENTLLRENITHISPLNLPIFIKDCDSFFDFAEPDMGNFICVSDLNDATNKTIREVASKSYVLSNDLGVVQSIAEKRIISNFFCVGGYGFDSGKNYLESYDIAKTVLLGNGTNQELFVSHVIQAALEKNKSFVTAKVSNYCDVGTANDWFEYNANKYRKEWFV